MRLVITAEHHFVKLPDGSFWGPDSMTYPFWARYLAVFDTVSVAARVRNVPAVSGEYTRIDGPGVSVHGLPDYAGPRAFLKIRREFRRQAALAVREEDAVLLRVGCSPLAAAIESALRGTGHPYGVEVITDPHMVFAPGAIRHQLRPIFRQMFTRQLKRQCVNAATATYVTRSALQVPYPAGPETYSTHYSDVDLPPGAFVAGARSGALLAGIPTIVSIGSMAQLYKGFDVLIEAVARCVDRGLGLRLVLIGDGRHRPELEDQVERRGLSQHVTFLGQLPGGGAIREQLDQADLFVLASRTEGLPRVMIEAQARALPCIGTDIGGIPELLDAADLVAPNDPEALATGIARVMSDGALRARQSARNLAVAHSYGEQVLQARRTGFLQELRKRTESWVSPVAAACVPRRRFSPGSVTWLTAQVDRLVGR